VLDNANGRSLPPDVHRFDAHIIPLEGPAGLLARVEKLLIDSGLSERDRSRLMADFAIFVNGHGG
jgi:hypothetical protein